jgi:hypothetical protein
VPHPFLKPALPPTVRNPQSEFPKEALVWTDNAFQANADKKLPPDPTSLLSIAGNWFHETAMENPISTGFVISGGPIAAAFGGAEILGISLGELALTAAKGAGTGAGLGAGTNALEQLAGGKDWNWQETKRAAIKGGFVGAFTGTAGVVSEHYGSPLAGKAWKGLGKVAAALFGL